MNGLYCRCGNRVDLNSTIDFEYLRCRLPLCDNISGFIDIVENVFIGYASDSNTFMIKTYDSGTQANDVLNRNTIKITIQLKSS